jgi:phosphoglycolate phosphatase-like HAD superfamily hydrolase
VDPSSVVYVGDTAGDVETARRAGCRSLLLATAWSWDPDVDPSLPDAVVSCFSSLPLALEEMP